MRRIFSVHAYVTGLVFAILVPFLFFTGLLVYRAASGEREVLTQIMRDGAAVVAGDLDRRVVSLVSFAEAIGNARMLQIDDLAQFYARWSREVNRESLTASLYTPTGEQVVNTTVPFGTPLPADPEAIHHVVETGEMEITGFVRTASTGAGVSINLPIRRDGALIYVLSLQITSAIATVMAQNAHQDVVATLFDHAERVINRSRYPERFAGANASRFFGPGTTGREAGSYTAESLEGVPIYVTFQRVNATGWVLAQAIPTQALYAPVYRSLTNLLAIGLGVFAFAGLTAWAIGKSIAGAVAGLSRVASTLDLETGGGPPLVTRIREVNAVADTLKTEILNRHRAEQRLVQGQKMEALGQLTGGMAHDFNNILGIIVGSLEIVRTLPPGDPASKDFTEEAMKAALQGSELISHLLAFARRQPLAPKPHDFNEIISQFARILSRTLGGDIEVDLQLADGVWPVLVDRAQLEAAITNLATNARHAMPHGGRLTIATRNTILDEDYVASHTDVTAGKYVLVELQDTGTGIPPDVLDRIFEPFFTTKGPGQGTGLGLSMVYGFLKQSGGHISVYSEVGEGTTVRLYLPPAREETAPDDIAPTPPYEPGQGEVVLAVEDNLGLLQVLVRQLTDGGYRVVPVENGRAAVDRLESGEAIDLLLTDIVMPGGLNGHDLARRAAELRPGLKVLLMSGFSDVTTETTAVPADPRILRKPYRKDELLHMVHRILKS
jgi:signal transduction histidine kinase/CheY-like chemotaxis protein